MKPQTVLIGLLTLTTVGGAVLAWNQYGELVELRASAMNRDERADLQKRVWDLERMSRELQDQLAAARAAATEEEPADTLAATVNGERPDGARRGPEFRGRREGLQQATAIRELMSKPEVQAMLSVQQKAAVDARYAALFRNLNLTPEQTEQLKSLLAERGNTRLDLMAAAREQGIDPRQNPEDFRKLFADAQNAINDSIKGVIGEQGFAQLQTYEQTLPQRNLVNDLQQRLSYSNSPLSPAQAEALVQILASNSSAGGSAGQPGNDVGPGRGPMRMDVIGGPGVAPMIGLFDGGRGGATVTPQAVTQASSVLTPTQVSALQQIQQQQQAQQQLQRLMRETLSANQPARAGTSTTPSGGQGATTPSPQNRRRPSGG